MSDKMKVFVSWSGERSRHIALALSDWLQDVLQSVRCWVSDVDIGAGAQWSAELKLALDDSAFGVLALTPENLDSRWMLFEAGYLAKSISGARVVPYLYGLKPTDVPFPLAQFQAAESTLAGSSKLVHTLNDASVAPMERERIDRLCQHWWPEMEKRLATIPAPPDTSKLPATPTRDDRGLLEEILGLLRGMSTTSDRQAPYGDLRDVLASGARPGLGDVYLDAVSQRIVRPLRLDIGSRNSRPTVTHSFSYPVTGTTQGQGMVDTGWIPSKEIWQYEEADFSGMSSDDILDYLKMARIAANGTELLAFQEQLNSRMRLARKVLDFRNSV